MDNFVKFKLELQKHFGEMQKEATLFTKKFKQIKKEYGWK